MITSAQIGEPGWLILNVVLAAVLGLVTPAIAQTGTTPALKVSVSQHQILLAWPTNADGFILESTHSLTDAASWVPQTNGLSLVGSNVVFTISSPVATAFYRLHNGITAPNAIVAPPRTWTWVEFTNCFCMEGTTTGIGVDLDTNRSQLLIFLNGGGACWDYTTCYVLNTAVHGPFGQAQFTNVAPQLRQLWFFDRSSTNNPFKDYSYVFVPYCTGDLHAGSQVDFYKSNETFQVGFLNMAGYLQRLVPTFPAVQRVVLAGSSAGGFGATFNWWQTQQAFSNARVDLIDDSGPILTPDVLSQGGGLLLPGSAPATNWDFSAALPSLCATCLSNLSSLYSFSATNGTAHRIALLSYNQDQTIRGYFNLTANQFTTGLNELATAQLQSQANVAYFFVAGQAHTLLETPSVAVSGVTVQQFITQMVLDDPAWASHHP